MSLSPGSQVDVTDFQVEHNPDGTHKGVSNLRWGLEAALPSSPAKGDKYIATDTKKEYSCFTPGTWESGATDIKVSVSLNDSTPGYLNGKLVAGVGIDLNELADGSNESLSVDIESAYVGLFCDGRLTLTTGVPVTTSDVTAATSVYFTNFRGNRLALWNVSSSRWKIYNFSEIAMSLSGLIKGVVYDIFVYDDAGTLTLEAVAWKKVTASNSPTAGSSKVINLSDTSTLAVGMQVTVKDGSNSEICEVTAVVASTSITVATLVNGYTTPDVYGYRDRATALFDQDAVPVKTGALDHRYLGSIRITSTTGQCEDSKARRYVDNYYNKWWREIRATRSTLWTLGTSTVQTWANVIIPGQTRVEFVTGDASRSVQYITVSGQLVTSAPGDDRCYWGYGINSKTAADSMCFSDRAGTSGRSGYKVCSYLNTPITAIGANYIQAIEFSASGGGWTVGGQSNGWYCDPFFHGFILM